MCNNKFLNALLRGALIGGGALIRDLFSAPFVISLRGGGWRGGQRGEGCILACEAYYRFGISQKKGNFLQNRGS